MARRPFSQKIFYEAMDTIKERSQDDPLKLFKKVLVPRIASPFWK